MTTNMEQLTSDLDELAGSLASSGREEEEQMVSQLNRSFEAEDWGSIADILKSIENTNQGRPARLSPQHHRLTPLSENIQCSVPPTPPLSPTETKPGGQGMQQLDHLLRMMEQMCSLQKQNSKLREQAEYLTAIKNLQELRNETLLENCHCDSHNRSSDPSGGVRFEPLQMPEETLSEPESQIGDDMNATRQRERRNSRARSIKRETKSRNLKKRSRSADPYGDGDKEPHRERGRVGIFSKFEKMKEKLTTRRGSVKRHPQRGRNDDEVTRRIELSTDGSLQMDGTETKSEDSGIYHVDPEDVIRQEMLQKSQEDFSDSEEVFSTPPLAPTSWGKPGAFSTSEGRKNSDFSTGSSSEDYLELKPKRRSRGPDMEGSVVYRRRRRDLSPHRLRNGEVDGENRTKVIRRSASFQDNISLNSDDDYEDAKSQWESKEAPAIMQGHMALHQSHSIPMVDSFRHGMPQRSDSSELKAAQKRKLLHRGNRVDETDSPCNGEQRPYSVDVLSSKNSPPEKKRPKGWEKVKHAVTRKHLTDGIHKKGLSEFYTELSPEDHEAFAAAEGVILNDRGQGSDERSGAIPTHYRRNKESSGHQSGGSTGTSNTSLAMFESLQANLSDDFTKKMEKWDKKKIKRGGVQLEKTRQTSLDSASSDATSSVQTPAVLDELQKNLSDDFTKKMLEWDKKKQRSSTPHCPPTEPKRKQPNKEKPKGSRPGSKIIKNKASVRGKESPQQRRRSHSPEGRKTPYSTEEIYSKESIALFEREDGEVLLEGVSKEFNKRYKEWERIKKMAVRHGDDPEAYKYRAENYFTDPKDSRKVAIIEQHRSYASETDDVYLVAHATPVIVEPEFDPALFQPQEAGSQAEFLEKSNSSVRTPSSVGDDSVYGESASQEGSGEQLGAGLNRLEQRNSLLAEQLRHKDVNLQAVSDELQTMQEQIDRITGEKHEMRRVSVCSSLGESALEAELTDIKSQIQQLEEQFDEKYPPRKRRSQDEVKGHKRRSGSRGKGDGRAPVGKVDESTSTDAVPEKIEVEVQTHDPDKPADMEDQNPGSPTTQLKKSLHEREAIIKLLQAEVDRQALELNFLRSGDTAGPFRRAKSFSARDRKTFDMRAMRIVDIQLNKSDKLEDLAEKADEMPELPTRRLDDFPVTHREKSDTLSSRSSQDSKRESLRSIQSSSTTQSLETLHISAEDIRMEESGGSEASDKPRSIRSQASDASSLETKSEPIRKVSLERKGDRREQRRESSPESATSLLRKRCNRDNIEILPNRRDISSRSDVKENVGKDKDNVTLPASPSRLSKVTPQIELVKLAQKPENQSPENSPKSPRRLVNVNHSPLSGSPIHIAKKWESNLEGSSESLGSKDGKSLVQERKEMFATRGRLEKSASLDSSQITGRQSRSDTVNKQKKLESVQHGDASDSLSSSPQRRPVTHAWVDKYDPVLSKSKKPEDKSVNNLRKKFSTMEYGSAPNVSEVGHQSLKDKYTPRARREVPKQGCVRQLSQAFSMISLMDGEQPRRGSQSSSVKSSPRSLSPASSTNSLVANQIKKLQDKATGSSSDVSSSRRQSVDKSKTSTRENSPAPGSSPLVTRREYRQSLPNIAVVRAKFDKTTDKSLSSATDSAADSEESSGTSNKPARVRSTPANRITYKVSVVNDEKEKSAQSASEDTKTEAALRVRSPRLVAVIESPPEKDEETVTFTVNPNPSRVRKVNSTPTGVRINGSNNSSGNVRRKSQMFIATVEETTTVTKKPKECIKEEEIKKEVATKVSTVPSKRQPRESAASSSVRPKEVNTSKPLDSKSSGRDESARSRRRRREQNNSTLSPVIGNSKAVDTTTGNVQSAIRSPDRRGRRNRNRREIKTHETDCKKVDTEKQDRPVGRGTRRERKDTKSEQTETQRKEAIIARRERREVREAAKVERKDSKKDKSSEALERKDSKNTKGDKKVVGHVERNDSTKSKRESVKIDRKDSKTRKDVRLQRTESDLKNEKKDTDSPLRSLRRRRSKKDELSAPNAEFDSTSEGASGNSEIGDNTSQGSDYPDLLATTRRKNKDGSSRIDGKSRCARAVVAHSALKGAEALIGTQLPKATEEDSNERKSRKDKDKSRRGRAINRADRISRLDLFRRARSVDSSKASKDRSPSNDRGKGDRAQSVDRTSKKRESSVDRQKGDGKNWLSKRTGSITNFLRASNKEPWEQDDDDSNHSNSSHRNRESWDHSEETSCTLLGCCDNCQHDSGFHENTSCDALHVASDNSDEWSCDSMYTTDEESDTQVSS